MTVPFVTEKWVRARLEQASRRVVVDAAGDLVADLARA